MQRNQIDEFYRELDATDEQFVRRKYATGGYTAWKAKHVKSWIEAKDEARKDRHTSWMTRWTMVTAVGTVALAVITVVGLLHH